MEGENQFEKNDIRIYNAVLLAFKGNKACGDERKKYAYCRATSVGRSGDPSFCESQAADFLQCYHEMVQYVRKSCQSQYMNAYDCLQSSDNSGMIKDFTTIFSVNDQTRPCQKAMRDFENC